MTAEPVIRLSGVSKRFVKYDDQPMLATAALRMWTRTRRSAMWALRDIDVDITAGEAVGVLGRNGAGKSTMLQLLAGVTAPTSGTVKVGGSVAPLISVGVGFHPELTGRENVYVNGAILGMSRRQLDTQLAEIVEFAELERFIDTPVKFYSSGMYVRLGFSVAVQARPDVLLVDEVLAVGDLAFQVKSFERMQQARRSGMTVVVVSHNLTAVRKFCERSVVLDSGNVHFDGRTDEALSVYHELLGQEIYEDAAEVGAERRQGMLAERPVLQVVGRGGRPTAHVASGGFVTLRFRIRAAKTIPRPFVGLAVRTADGMVVYADTNHFEPFPPVNAGESAVFEVRMRLPLATGSYTLEGAVYNATAKLRATQLGRVNPTLVYVSARDTVHGVADLRAEFTRASRTEPAPTRAGRQSAQ